MTKIKEMRKRLDWTQEELSKELEIPLPTLRKWEIGDRTPAPWAEKLIIEKLERELEEMKTEKFANEIREIVAVETVVYEVSNWLPQQFGKIEVFFPSDLEPLQVDDSDVKWHKDSNGDDIEWGEFDGVDVVWTEDGIFKTSDRLYKVMKLGGVDCFIDEYGNHVL